MNTIPSSFPRAAGRGALLLAVAALVAPAFAATPEHAPAHSPVAAHAAVKKPAAVHATAKKTVAAHAGAKKLAKPAAGPSVAAGPGPLADFGKENAPPDVVKMANWVSWSRNNGKRGFIVIDKKQAELYLFDPQGRLKSHTPVLVGMAAGDRSAPGIGDKPLSKIPDNEKTTPAGRYLAMLGKNNHGAPVVWIDYNAAVSMHSVHSVSAGERREQRLATPDPSDNHISNGCVNVPARYYSSVLLPTITKVGAIIYVLPETMPPQQVFGSLEIGRTQVAQGAPAAARKGG